MAESFTVRVNDWTVKTYNELRNADEVALSWQNERGRDNYVRVVASDFINREWHERDLPQCSNCGHFVLSVNDNCNCAECQPPLETLTRRQQCDLVVFLANENPTNPETERLINYIRQRDRQDAAQLPRWERCLECDCQFIFDGSDIDAIPSIDPLNLDHPICGDCARELIASETALDAKEETMVTATFTANEVQYIVEKLR
jgi:hypothetical protein